MAEPARRPALHELNDVLERVLAEARARRVAGTETLPTAQALGRTLAAPVLSGLNVPPADNSSMDGYAVRVADLDDLARPLEVAQRIPAGQVGAALRPDTVARIFTGAPVPEGADAIVMQEQAELLPASEALPPLVRFSRRPSPGEWIRRRGEDVELGASVLASGTLLGAQSLGMAASVGAATLEVVRRPRVALFSTGDELAMPGEPLRPGAIYNSNRFTLRAMVESAGGEVLDLGIVPDRLDATREALRAAAQEADLILTCGGVSVGEEDHLRPAAQAEGRIDFFPLAIKPGKPFALGAIRGAEGGDTLLIGLPGNPVSSFVTFLLLVLPALRALLRQPSRAWPSYSLQAEFDWPRPDSRREFLRAKRSEQGGLLLYPNQSSGVLSSLVWADGLIDNPPGRAIARGDSVRFLPLSGFFQP